MLEAGRVAAVFDLCLVHSPPTVDDIIVVEGIEKTAIFQAAQLVDYHDEIVAMLQELPDEFQAAKGGGWSFLNACNDKNGRQWTGLHQTMDQLFMLGQAIGRVRPCLPREFWSNLPGGMPYYVISEED
jgi:hypothetical protein